MRLSLENLSGPFFRFWFEASWMLHPDRFCRSFSITTVSHYLLYFKDTVSNKQLEYISGVWKFFNQVFAHWIRIGFPSITFMTVNTKEILPPPPFPFLTELIWIAIIDQFSCFYFPLSVFISFRGDFSFLIVVIKIQFTFSFFFQCRRLLKIQFRKFDWHFKTRQHAC